MWSPTNSVRGRLKGRLVAGQDVKQWTFDITDWVDNSTNNTNHLEYRGYYNGQEYVPSDGIGNGGRNIRAVVWIVFYGPTT